MYITFIIVVQLEETLNSNCVIKPCMLKNFSYWPVDIVGTLQIYQIYIIADCCFDCCYLVTGWLWGYTSLYKYTDQWMQNIHTNNLISSSALQMFIYCVLLGALFISQLLLVLRMNAQNAGRTFKITYYFKRITCINL